MKKLVTIALLALCVAATAFAEPPPAPTGTVATVQRTMIPLGNYGPGSYIAIVADSQGRIAWSPTQGATTRCGDWVPNTLPRNGAHGFVAARFVLDTNPNPPAGLASNPVNIAWNNPSPYRGLVGVGLYNDPVYGWTFHDKSDIINNVSQGSNAEPSGTGDPTRLGPNTRAQALNTVRQQSPNVPINDRGTFVMNERIAQLQRDGILDQHRCPARPATSCSTRIAARMEAINRTRGVVRTFGQSNPAIVGGQLQGLARQGHVALILGQAVLAVAQVITDDNARRRMALLNRNAEALRVAYNAWLYGPASGIAAAIAPMPGRTDESRDNAIQNIGSGYIAYFFTADEIRAAQQNADPMAFMSLQYQAFELYYGLRFAQETNWVAPCTMTRHRARDGVSRDLLGSNSLGSEFNDIVCRQEDGTQVVYVNLGWCQGRLTFSQTPMLWSQYLRSMMNQEWTYDHRYDSVVTPAPNIGMPWRDVPRVELDRFMIAEDAVWRAMANLGVDQGAACTNDVTDLQFAANTSDTSGVCCTDGSCTGVTSTEVVWSNPNTTPGPGTGTGTSGNTNPTSSPTDVATAQRALAGSLYFDVLNRTAADSEIAWASGVVATQGNAVLARTMLSSLEARYVFVNQLYLSALGRPGDPGGLNYWSSVLAPGDPLPVLVGLLGSDEYFFRQGGSNVGFVNGLYRDLLQRPLPPTSAEVSYWATIAAMYGRASVVSGFVYSAEYRSRVVTAWYRIYLRRVPSSAEVGWWAAQLASYPNWREHQVGFLASPEYALLHRQ